MGTLVQDKSGAFYGTASGLDGVKESWGIVYKLTPSVKGKRWSYSILCKFNHEPGGGRYPIGGLVLDPQGNLYGGTENGVVFELSPPTQSNGAWSYQTLWSANAGTWEGGAPVGTLLRERDGALYGTIGTDPENPYGAIFRLLPPTTAGASWTYQTLYSFQFGSDGVGPAGVIADASGNLYGTAGGGLNLAGTVFELLRPSTGDAGWSFNLLYSLRGGSTDGYNPIGNLYLSPGGALYGVTAQGGTSGQGLVFQLAPPAKGQTAWTESVIYQFASSDQAFAMGGVIGSAAGYLYGTTAQNMSNHPGTVYRLAPPAPGGSIWQEKTVVDFKTAIEPEGSLLRTSNGTFYGTSRFGGTSNLGTVFQVGP
jgi:uncharacterized repeat protein (TIGR03803 family)